MKKYKPGYLGKVIPADDQTQLTDFVTNKYDSFSEIYDVCKDESEHIDDIERVNSSSDNPTELKVKVSAKKEAVEKIQSKTKDSKNVKMIGNVISANSE